MRPRSRYWSGFFPVAAWWVFRRPTWSGASGQSTALLSSIQRRPQLHNLGRVQVPGRRRQGQREAVVGGDIPRGRDRAARDGASGSGALQPSLEDFVLPDQARIASTVRELLDYT